MSILAATAPIDAITVDLVRFPDRDERLILEHLTRYCGKFEVPPSIGIALENGNAVVVRGHKYLRAFQALKRSTIRVVATSGTSSEDWKRFLTRPGVAELDWEAIRAAEDAERSPMQWHVFYFERPLAARDRAAFEALITSAFPARAPLEISYQDDGLVVEFEVSTPVAHEWSRDYLASLIAFDRERVPILSFQGSRFGPFP